MKEQARAGREMCSVVLQYCCLHRGGRGTALVVVSPLGEGLDTWVLALGCHEGCRRA